MARFIRTGSGGICERALFLVDANSVDDVPSLDGLDSPRFACLIAWEALGVNVDAVRALARRLITAGCVYASCWGAGCERVHDIFDEIDLDIKPNGPITMTTWHDDEPFSEALWFLLFNSCPDDAYFDDCRASVVITIGSPSWAAEASAAMSDLGEFNRRMLP